MMALPSIPHGSPDEALRTLRAMGVKIVTWPEDADDGKGDAKGPREKSWQKHEYAGEARDGWRYGALTGIEISPGKHLTDYDVDWADGWRIASILLPQTELAFGRAGKPLSHAMYTTPLPFQIRRYVDTDKVLLLEVRGVKTDGSIGLQTMIPPSTWSKGMAREPLEFRKFGGPSHLETNEKAARSADVVAIGLILGRALGRYGFGHEARLAWAGAMLKRWNFTVEETIAIGYALSEHCENDEVDDVRTVIESTKRAIDARRKALGGPGLAKLLGERGPAIVARIDEWMGKADDFIRGKNGQPLSESQDNIRRAFTLFDVEFSYNVFAEKALIKDGPDKARMIDDDALSTLRFRIDREYKFRPSKELFWDVARDVAREHNFHPVHDWLAALTWDGVSRIDLWLRDYVGAEDSEYMRAISAIFLIAAVRRIKHPGSKFDEMIILEGAQGYDKSSALQALCFDTEWFSDDLPLNVDSKQFIEKTIGKWIIEASELSNKSKADIEHLKALLSRQIDGPARLAYARSPVERPRQSVIAGTTNKRQYLTDMTGGRRFWPIEIRRCDVAGILVIRDQLWAEAAKREKEGASIRLPEHLWTVAGELQELRREGDAWEDVIEAAISDIPLRHDGRRRVCAKDLWGALMVPLDRRDKRGSTRISEIMQKFGFKSMKVRDDGGSGKVESGYVEIAPSGFAPQQKLNSGLEPRDLETYDGDVPDSLGPSEEEK